MRSMVEGPLLQSEEPHRASRGPPPREIAGRMLAALPPLPAAR